MAFPGSVTHAAERAWLVLGGAGVQFASTATLLGLFSRRSAGAAAVTEAIRSAADTLTAEVSSWTLVASRAVRLAVTLAVAVEAWRLFHLPNGYWRGMTALLLVRPSPGGTFVRAVERASGTVAGAAAATVVTHAFPTPTPRGSGSVGTRTGGSGPGSATG